MRGVGLVQRYIRMTLPALGWIMIAILIVFGARVWSLYGDAHLMCLQVKMHSSVQGKAIVYYDLGDGLSEKDSVQAAIEKGGDSRHYLFCLPNREIRYLRFDPLESDGHVEIQAIRVIDGLGNSLVDIELSRIKPIQQITKFERSEHFISLDIKERADDPQLAVFLSKPLRFTGFHPAFYNRLAVEFFVVALAFILLSLWTAWEDRKQFNRWIYRGVIAVGLAVVVFFCLQTCLAILRKSILPITGGDSEVFSYLAMQRWASPDFYHGLRPWTVPLFYSLVGGARNTKNLILMQTTISYASWIFLAISASRLLNNDLLKAVAFMAVILIPLNIFMRGWNLTILSESISFSLLAIFFGIYFWYFRTGSKASALALAFAALLFAFTRDTDAYRVLFMALPILLIIIQHLQGKSRVRIRHVALFATFLIIFVASDLSSSNIHYSKADIPYTNARWYFPMLDNMGLRILQNEEMLEYFVDQGLPVTPALKEMAGKWASSNDWQWYNDPNLVTQRKWLYQRGRQAYMRYLLTHPEYTLLSAYYYRGAMIFPDDVRNAWDIEINSPINLHLLSPLLLNDERELRMFLALFPSALILIGLVWIWRARGDSGTQIHQILLVSYMILITIPHAILVFHGDLMDHPRHQYTNIIQLNIGVVLFYLLSADWWLGAMRLSAKKA